MEPLSLARSGCAAAVTGGHLYVVGGFARATVSPLLGRSPPWFGADGSVGHAGFCHGKRGDFTVKMVVFDS